MAAPPRRSRSGAPLLAPVALLDLAKDLAIRDARHAPDAFARYVLRDEKGAPLAVAALHLAMQAHLTWAWGRGLVAVVEVPMGHGKTTYGVVGRTLWEIGQNQNIRALLACNDAGAGANRVRAIRSYILSDAYRDVFPNIVPARKPGTRDLEEWSDSAIRVARTAVVTDPTVAAAGVDGKVTGARADLLVADDIVDWLNAIANPAKRSKVTDAWEETWESRKVEGAREVYFSTPWHERDTTAVMEKRGDVALFKARVNADVDGLDVEVRAPVALDGYPIPDGARPVNGGVVFTLPLWERGFSAKTLRAEKRTKPRAFARARELRVFTHGEVTYPSVSTCFEDVRAADIAPTAVRVAAGVDLSSKTRPGTVVAVVGVDATGSRLLLDVRRGRWTSPQTADQMLAVDAAHRPGTWVVETNGLQEALVEWLVRDPRYADLAPRVVGHHTGTNKADLDVGLPSIEAEFSTRRWRIPAKEWEGHDASCECAWCAWRNEFAEHPGGATTDAVMATWFADMWLATAGSATAHATVAPTGDEPGARHRVAAARPAAAREAPEYDDAEPASPRLRPGVAGARSIFDRRQR